MKTSTSLAGEGKLDAGLRSVDHCRFIHSGLQKGSEEDCLLTNSSDRSKFPSWRYAIRQQCLSLVRWETPYLAWMQERVRSPALDSYFAVAANLGTHTFFMVAIPVLFWCGYTTLGRV